MQLPYGHRFNPCRRAGGRHAPADSGDAPPRRLASAAADVGRGGSLPGHADALSLAGRRRRPASDRPHQWHGGAHCEWSGDALRLPGFQPKTGPVVSAVVRDGDAADPHWRDPRTLHVLCRGGAPHGGGRACIVLLQLLTKTTAFHSTAPKPRHLPLPTARHSTRGEGVVLAVSCLVCLLDHVCSLHFLRHVRVDRSEPSKRPLACSR
mmetsp:Transcript_23371/g.46676  ORF Transcript_23371/g.46676 Transcript_23371/m.46676 type:complete len:208 (+) Transcript_23371:732-1355(+)